MYAADEAMLALQERRKELFDKQMSQGGIIDLEYEKQKHRLPPSQKRVSQS